MRRSSLLPFVLGSLVLLACDRDGSAYVFLENPDFPGILNLGRVEVVTQDQLSDPESLNDFVTFVAIGPPPDGQVGGATATFIGTGGNVCVMVDPEAVYWAQSISPLEPQEGFLIPDNYRDDGDVDLFGSLSANYTGSPGLELGAFASIYEDPLGNQILISTNECRQVDYYGDPVGHSGRATLEYCTIDTSLHPGKEYTVVLETFSIPFDDELLTYGFVVVEGACTATGGAGGGADVATVLGGLDECTIGGEARLPVTDGGGNVQRGADGLPVLEPRPGFDALEQAFCANELADFCTNNPDYCGEVD